MSIFKPVRSFVPSLLAALLVAGALPAQDELDEKVRRMRSDAQRLARLRLWVKELGAPDARFSQSGLKVGVGIIPDLRAYEIARAYVEARDAKRSHSEAVETVRGTLEGLQKIEKLAATRVHIENPRYRSAPPALRVYTIEERFPGRVATLRSGRKRVPVSLLEKPENLRVAKLRIKKFWRAGKGTGRSLVPPRGGGKPPPGWEPVLSKPIAASVIEGQRVAFDLVFKKLDADELEKLQLVLAGLKRFDGPFESDHVDLNDGREWEELPAMVVPLRLPPEGAKLPREVRALLAEVEGARKK